MRGWTLVSERKLASYPLISLKERTLRNDATGVTIPFVVAHLSDWVNVVAITRERKVVFVEQGRAGMDAVTLEIAGGTIEDGEDPRRAAEREMLEETGYRAGSLEYLGKVAVNPAFQDNWCHFFLATECEVVCSPHPDPGEDVAVKLMDVDDVEKAIDDGRIVHSLGILGLLKALRWQAQHGSRASR